MMPALTSPSRPSCCGIRLSAFARVVAPRALAVSLVFYSGSALMCAQTSSAPVVESAPATATALSLPPVSKRKTDAASDAYLDGARLLDRKDLSGAEKQFAKAVSLNPRNPDYAMALTLAHEHRVTDLIQQAGKARLMGHNEAAEALIAEARTLDPQNSIVTQHFDSGAIPAGFMPSLDSKAGIAYAGPITLLPAGSAQSFHLRADVRDVFKTVAQRYGINAVFDPSVSQQSVRFDLDDSPYTQAMPILLDMARLFAVPLDAHTIFVAKDSIENRQRLERQLEETIYIPAMTNEQMTELSNVVRNIFDLKQVTVQNGIGTMVVRAPESVMSAMNLTLADLIDGGSQVMLDLQLYSVDKTRSRKMGAQLPQQLGIYNVQSAAHNLVAANQSLVDQAVASGLVPAGATDITIALALIASGLVQSALLSNTLGFIGGGLTQTGITTNATPTFTLSLNSSDTRILDDVQLRMGDRQTSTFRAGTRYPITTASYTVGSTASTSTALAGVSINGVSASTLLSQLTGSGSSLTVPQISYEDLGITLKATPVVQKSNNVTLHLDFKIEALTGGVIDNIPVLASRQFTSDITIKDGETALMMSSLSKLESGAISGVPGIGELPGFQSTVSNKATELDSSDLVLLITPHIVRRRSGIISGPRIAINLPPSSE